MTNREYLFSLSDEKLAEALSDCRCCVGNVHDATMCGKYDCKTGRLKWLRAEHKVSVHKKYQLRRIDA